MADQTHISWADATFNPWVGCMKVSPACDGCYAEHLMDTRMGRVIFGGPGKGVGTRERTSAANWKKPLAWNRKQEVAWALRECAVDRYENAPTHREMPPPLTPFFVFCSSLADVFDNAVPAEWRRDLFKLIRATPHLTWLLLTKRPQNIVKLAYDALSCAEESPVHLPFVRMAWPRNAAIGCTVVTQEEADRDVPHLLRAKAAIDPAFAFLSMEPLLAPVDIRPWFACHPLLALASTYVSGDGLERVDVTGALVDGLDWVITGGETDQGPHKARPTATDWFRTIRDQCAAAGVAYHHKQNGEWAPLDDEPEPNPVFRLGKARAGRMLDGVVHDARPAVRA